MTINSIRRMRHLRMILMFSSLGLMSTLMAQGRIGPIDTTSAVRSTVGRQVSQDASAGQIALHKVQQDIAIAGILQALQHDAPRGPVILRNVRVVDPIQETITPNESLVIEGSRISWVGDKAKEPKITAKVIDGADHYVSPGLNDMHVHTSTADGWLLDLANGVTAVRDMAGFPWMLKARDSINAGRMLAPSLSVAGPLINDYGLFGYAVVPANSLDARRHVRLEAACGYDFIKLWNIVPRPIFDAVAQQARLDGMDLIGHVPHDISVRYAAQSGMRTMEHLKGFLDDSTLRLGDTDYGAVIDTPAVWNTPTLYANRAFARGDEAKAYLASSESQYVPLRVRRKWLASQAGEESAANRQAREAEPILISIVKKLVSLRAKFLAGTDADNYPFQVMGFGLVDELGLLQSAGLTPGEALRAATTEPAIAMREAEECGQIAQGMRADLVLLDENPLKGASVFKVNRGVMVRGVWLEESSLKSALAKLAAIFAEPDNDVVLNEETARSTLSQAGELSKDGFVLDARQYAQLAKLLREAGYATTAEGFDSLADIPRTGPCAESRPME